MPRTPAENAASVRWEAKTYDKVLLRLRRDGEPTREQIAAAADAAGESMQAYIIEAVRQRIAAEKTGDSGPE